MAGLIRDWSLEYPTELSGQYRDWLGNTMQSSGVAPIPGTTGTTGGGWLNTLFGDRGVVGGLSALGGLGLGIMQGLAGFQQLNLANKAYGLAKQQFGFQKALANRNLANQAKIINNTYDNAAQVAAGMIGGKDASGNYGFTNPTLVNDYANKAKQQHVNGSPI